MNEINIAGRKVGKNYPPLIIPEVGINHEGDISKAKECVDAAVEAGAEIIKFQCHITEEEMVPTNMTPGKISSEKLWDIIKRCELTEDEEIEIQEYCSKKNIIYLSTPFSRKAADRLQKMNVSAFKIGSGECNNLPLILHIAKMGKPLIISTGMNDIEQIQRTASLVSSQGVPFALMHCTSIYPTPSDKVRLGAITQLIDLFPDNPIGFSDHSLGIWISMASAALGASIIEKHFTLSRSWPGPDVPISIEPNELKDLIEGSKLIWTARGGSKTILEEEQPVIDFAYATVVSIAPIQKGEELNLNNIWVKRPGTGAILADRLDEIIGRSAARDIQVDSHLSPLDIKEFE